MHTVYTVYVILFTPSFFYFFISPRQDLVVYSVRYHSPYLVMYTSIRTVTLKMFKSLVKFS